MESGSHRKRIRHLTPCVLVSLVIPVVILVANITVHQQDLVTTVVSVKDDNSALMDDENVDSSYSRSRMHRREPGRALVKHDYEKYPSEISRERMLKGHRQDRPTKFREYVAPKRLLEYANPGTSASEDSLHQASHGQNRERIAKAFDARSDDNNPPVHSYKTTTAAPPRRPGPYDPPNCNLLIQGNSDELQRAEVQQALTRHLYKLATPRDIIHDTADCTTYLSTKGYVIDTLSQEEADFPIAYSIRLHHKVDQAERLLRAIYRPQNIYCLYIDKKAATEIHTAMRALASCFDNVFVASKLSNFVYQSFSPVEADIQCMKELLQSRVQWKYYLNLAGTEFPLKTNLEIVRILKALNGTNDIEQYPYPSFFKDRINTKYRVDGQHLSKTILRKENFTMANVSILKGCSYNSFSRPFVEWVLSDIIALSFTNWTQDLHSPDEVVWASLNNLPGAPGGYTNMVTQISRTFLSRAIIWHNSLLYCPHKHLIHGICIFSAGSLPWLSGRWELFANKFDTVYDHIVLDCLEQSLNSRRKHPDPDTQVNWHGIYRAPHVKTKPSAGIDLNRFYTPPLIIDN